MEGQDKTIKPVRNFKYLGVELHDSTKWNHYLMEGKNNLTKTLKTRLNAIRRLLPFMSFLQRRIVLNGLIISIMMYGAPIWGGAPMYLKSKIKSLQLEAARLAIGPKSKKWSASKLLKTMKWLPLEDLIKKATMKIIHGMVFSGQPPLLTFRTMGAVPGNNQQNTRRTGPLKIGNRPKKIGRTMLTKHQFRARSYDIYATLPEEILKIKSNKLFGKWVDKRPKKHPEKMIKTFQKLKKLKPSIENLKFKIEKQNIRN